MFLGWFARFVGRTLPYGYSTLPLINAYLFQYLLEGRSLLPGIGPGLLVQHVYFGECEFDSLTALQAHGEAPYLARFGVFGKVDNLPVFSTVEAALHGGCRSAYPDPPT